MPKTDDVKVFNGKVVKLSNSLDKLDTQVRQCKLDLCELVSSAKEVRVISVDNIIPLFGDEADTFSLTPKAPKRTRKTAASQEPETGPDQEPGADHTPELDTDPPE